MVRHENEVFTYLSFSLFLCNDGNRPGAGCSGAAGSACLSSLIATVLPATAVLRRGLSLYSVQYLCWVSRAGGVETDRVQSARSGEFGVYREMSVLPCVSNVLLS